MREGGTQRRDHHAAPDPADPCGAAAAAAALADPLSPVRGLPGLHRGLASVRLPVGDAPHVPGLPGFDDGFSQFDAGPGPPGAVKRPQRFPM